MMGTFVVELELGVCGDEIDEGDRVDEAVGRLYVVVVAVAGAAVVAIAADEEEEGDAADVELVAVPGREGGDECTFALEPNELLVRPVPVPTADEAAAVAAAVAAADKCGVDARDLADPDPLLPFNVDEPPFPPVPVIPTVDFDAANRGATTDGTTFRGDVGREPASLALLLTPSDEPRGDKAGDAVEDRAVLLLGRFCADRWLASLGTRGFAVFLAVVDDVVDAGVLRVRDELIDGRSGRDDDDNDEAEDEAGGGCR